LSLVLKVSVFVTVFVKVSVFVERHLDNVFENMWMLHVCTEC